MTKIVKVNNNCIGCGACVAICGGVFSFSDEGKAFVDGSIACGSADCIDDAKNMCPVDAIECEDE